MKLINKEKILNDSIQAFLDEINDTPNAGASAWRLKYRDKTYPLVSEIPKLVDKLLRAYNSQVVSFNKAQILADRGGVIDIGLSIRPLLKLERELSLVPEIARLPDGEKKAVIAGLVGSVTGHAIKIAKAIGVADDIAAVDPSKFYYARDGGINAVEAAQKPAGTATPPRARSASRCPSLAR